MKPRKKDKELLNVINELINDKKRVTIKSIMEKGNLKERTIKMYLPSFREMIKAHNSTIKVKLSAKEELIDYVQKNITVVDGIDAKDYLIEKINDNKINSIDEINQKFNEIIGYEFIQTNKNIKVLL